MKGRAQNHYWAPMKNVCVDLEMQRYSGVLLALGACLAGLVIALLVHEHAQGHRRHTRGGAPGDPSLTSIHDIGTMMRIMRYLDPKDRVRLSMVDRHNRDMAQSVRKVAFGRVYEIENVVDFSRDGEKALHYPQGLYRESPKKQLIVSTLSEPVTQVEIDTDPFVSIAFGSDNQTVIYWGIGKLQMLNIEKDEQSPVQMPPGVRVICASYSPDGNRIAVGTNTGELRLYSTSRDLLKTLAAPDDFADSMGHPGNSVAFSPDGTRVFFQRYLVKRYLGKQYVVYIWDIEAERCLNTMTLENSTTGSFSPDNKKVLFVNNGKLGIWDVNGKDVQTFELPPEKRDENDQNGHLFTTAIFSPDGRRIVAGTQGGELSVWGLHGSLEQPPAKLGAKIELIKFSTRGDLLNIATSKKCFQYNSLILDHYIDTHPQS